MESGNVPDAREESTAQRDDRNLSELIQELRVAGLGVQVLFGFLPFAPVHHPVQPPFWRAAGPVPHLPGPVLQRAGDPRAGRGRRAVLAAVALLTWFTAGAVAGGVITAVIGVLLAGLWFAVPLVSRDRS